MVDAGEGQGQHGRPARRVDRPRLFELMAMIAGLAVGLWLVVPDLRSPNQGGITPLADLILIVAVAVLGGLAVVGPPLLLWERRRNRRPWAAGRLLWFATGTSAWLLWPPVITKRLDGSGFGNSETGVCFAYGTPLMALYVVASLLAGRHLSRGRRRRIRRSWRETFGLLLGLAWACTGLYLLVGLYRAAWWR